jgi:hypothetical protein
LRATGGHPPPAPTTAAGGQLVTSYRKTAIAFRGDVA